MASIIFGETTFIENGIHPRSVFIYCRKMKQKPIFVTQPALPPLDEFIPYLEQIWVSKILTNNGSFHQQFEQALADYLGVKIYLHFHKWNSGSNDCFTSITHNW